MLAQLILDNRRTLRCVRAAPPFVGLAGLVALRECARLERLETLDWIGHGFGVDATASGAAPRETSVDRDRQSPLENREARGVAVVQIVASCRRLAFVGVTRARNFATQPRKAELSPEETSTILRHVSAADSLVTELTLRDVSAACLANLGTRLTHLDLQLGLEVSFPHFCAAVALHLPAMRRLAILHVATLHGHSQSTPDEEFPLSAVGQRASEAALRAKQSNGRIGPTGGDSGDGGGGGGDGDGDDGKGGVHDRVKDDVDARPACVWRSHSLRQLLLRGGTRASVPRHWPRIVAPNLRELRGMFDLWPIVDTLVDSPQIETIDCTRAHTPMCTVSADTGTVADAATDADAERIRADYQRSFDRDGRPLMSDRAITALCAAFLAPTSAAKLATLRLREFPCTSEMLGAIRCGCPALTAFSAHVESNASSAGFHLLVSRGPRLCEFVLQALIARGHEVSGRLRDPVVTERRDGSSAGGDARTDGCDGGKSGGRNDATAGGCNGATAGSGDGTGTERDGDAITSRASPFHGAAAPRLDSLLLLLLLPRLEVLALPKMWWLPKVIEALRAPNLTRVCVAPRVGARLDRLLGRLPKCRDLTVVMHHVELAGVALACRLAWEPDDDDGVGKEQRVGGERDGGQRSSPTGGGGERAKQPHRRSSPTGGGKDSDGKIGANERTSGGSSGSNDVANPGRHDAGAGADADARCDTRRDASARAGADGGGAFETVAPNLAVTKLTITYMGTQSVSALASWCPRIDTLHVEFRTGLSAAELEVALLHLRQVTHVSFCRLARLVVDGAVYAGRTEPQCARIDAALLALIGANPRVADIKLPRDAGAVRQARLFDTMRTTRLQTIGDGDGGDDEDNGGDDGI
jgi:hypothetical protein